MYPDDLKYHKEHTWVRQEDGLVRVGISDYAQEALGEIVFIEVPNAGTEVVMEEPFGEIESRKSVSDLYSPVSGTIKEVNAEVVDAPEIINEDPYDKGWILTVEITDPSEIESLLTATEYEEMVTEEEE